MLLRQYVPYFYWFYNFDNIICFHRLETSDVLVKGGEWKLGIDEEPLPFQIVKVAAILRHPDYVPGSNDHGLALLVLAEKLRLAKNIGTICLPPANKIPTNNCLTTGWGKRILQRKFYFFILTRWKVTFKKYFSSCQECSNASHRR